MEIPKRPDVPPFIDQYIDHISDIVFGNFKEAAQYDAILVFGGSHPKIWEAAIDQYERQACSFVFVTGGNKPNAKRHETWVYGDQNEADVIGGKLLEGGIPKERIVIENRSTNSGENVLFIRDEILKRPVETLLCVCKSYGAGRQYRTIKKHIPNIDILIRSVPTDINSYGDITKGNWHRDSEVKSMVWGEYLRNCYYSARGLILQDFIPDPGLRGYLSAMASKGA